MANMYDTEKNRRSTCCAMSCCAMSVCALVALVVIGLDFAIFLRSPWIELTVGAATTVGTTTPTETATSSGTHTPTNAAEAMVARSVQPTSAVSSAVLTPRSQTPGNTTKFEFWFIGTSIGDRVWGELGYFPVVSSKDLKDNLALDDQKVKDLQDQISFDVSPWVHGINGVPPSLISSFILLVAQQVLTITIISRKWSRIAPSFPCAPIPKTTGTQRSRSRKDCWGCRDGCRDCCSQCPVVFVLEILVLAAGLIVPIALYFAKIKPDMQKILAKLVSDFKMDFSDVKGKLAPGYIFIIWGISAFLLVLLGFSYLWSGRRRRADLEKSTYQDQDSDS